MKLTSSKAFIRDTGRLLKKNPQLREAVEVAISRLYIDPFQPILRTHTLKGKLRECWSSSVAYDLRIVFEIVRDDGEPMIILQTIGTHKGVY